MILDVTARIRGVIAAAIDGAHADPQAPPYGGYVIFARNGTSVAQVRELTDALRERSQDGVPPLIAIDQEGGCVARLREGVEPLPSMMALGAAGDAELAGRAGEQLAHDLRRAGCTIDFAPVLDLALERENTVIGTRSIGSDPAAVASLGGAFARGLERGGIVPCFKHFPGHGRTAVDSHVALPVVEADAATLRARDLAPFASVAPQAAAFMGAHVLVRAFDRTLPATLSSSIIERLLRGELGFQGAYVTDAMEMGAIAAGAADGAVQALAAGADLLLFSTAQAAREAEVAIERAVRSGIVSARRLDEAHARVMRLRRSGAAPLPIGDFAPHPGVGRETARRAVTLIRGVPHADPVTSCAINFAPAAAEGAREPTVFAPGAPHFPLSKEAPALDECWASIDPPADEVCGLFERLARTQRRPLLLARRAHLHPRQAAAIAQIVDRYPDAVVVSTLEPYDVTLFEKARHVLATYGDDAAAMAGLADVLFGGSMPEGRLPVAL
jgi:beta-N-acetylhexosaminidase